MLIFKLLLILFSLFNLCLSLKIGDNCVDLMTGKNGTCQLIKNCESVLLKIDGKHLPTICDNRRHSAVICCVESDEAVNKIDVSDNTALSDKIKNSVRYKNCARYAEMQRKQRFSMCAVTSSYNKYISNIALPGEFPHVVKIGLKSWKSNDITDIAWKCGGALISENYILTTPLCFANQIPNVSNIKIYLGSNRYYNPKHNADTSVLESASEIKIDPSWQLLLIKLKNSIKINLDIFPACLPLEDDSIKSKNAFMTYWGAQGKSHSKECSYLQKLDFNLNSTRNCKTKNRNSMKSHMKCGVGTSYLPKRQTNCSKKLGGLIQTPNPIINCTYILNGIALYSHRPAHKNKNSHNIVYLNISEHIDFIEKIVWEGENETL